MSKYQVNQLYFLEKEYRFSLTRVLPLEGCDSQILADLLLQHVILSCVIWRPLVLCQVLCWEIRRAGRAVKGQQGLRIKTL